MEKAAEKTLATKTGPDALKLISVSEPGFSLVFPIFYAPDPLTRGAFPALILFNKI